MFLTGRHPEIREVLHTDDTSKYFKTVGHGRTMQDVKTTEPASAAERA